MSENTRPTATLGLNADAVPAHHRTWWGVALKLIVALAIVGALFYVWSTWIQPYETQLSTTMRQLGPWAPVIFIVVFVVATSLFFPESLLAIAAGTIWGLWWGLLWVVVAGVITAMVIFWLGRYVLGNKIEQLLSKHPKVQAIDDAASDSGFKLALLLRLAPLNFTMLNMLLAVSRLRFRTYLLTCIGMFPGNFSTVYIGFAARHAADQLKNQEHAAANTNTVHEITLYVGLGASLLVSIIIARVAMVAIKNATSGGT